MSITVRAAWDDDACVWYVEESDLFGVHAEAATLDELRGKLPNVIEDVLSENDPLQLRHDITIELIAYARTQMVAGAA